MLITTGSLLLVVNGKADSFILLNSCHSLTLNTFFISYTFIGDGIFALGFILLLFIVYKDRKQGIALLLAFFMSGLVVQVMKNIFNSPRPKLFFAAGYYKHFIEGVSLANNASLPSGHTATAFAIATVLALLIKNKNHQFLILLIAALVGYSRIYLGQHFLIDVITGALIGCISGMLSVYLAFNINERHLNHKYGPLKLTLP